MTHRASRPGPASIVELQHEIEQFLYHEAALLAEREYRDWLDLFADDIHYWMPTRYNRLRRETGPGSSPNRTRSPSSTRTRTRSAGGSPGWRPGMAWAEDPPSRTRHLFTNVRVMPTETADEFDVHCNFLLYRSRLEHDVEFFVGARQDLLRRVDRGVGWEIARRKVVLDQSTLQRQEPLDVLLDPYRGERTLHVLRDGTDQRHRRRQCLRPAGRRDQPDLHGDRSPELRPCRLCHGGGVPLLLVHHRAGLVCRRGGASSPSSSSRCSVRCSRGWCCAGSTPLPSPAR